MATNSVHRFLNGRVPNSMLGKLVLVGIGRSKQQEMLAEQQKVTGEKARSSGCRDACSKHFISEVITCSHLESGLF